MDKINPISLKSPMNFAATPQPFQSEGKIEQDDTMSKVWDMIIRVVLNHTVKPKEAFLGEIQNYKSGSSFDGCSLIGLALLIAQASSLPLDFCSQRLGLSLPETTRIFLYYDTIKDFDREALFGAWCQTVEALLERVSKRSKILLPLEDSIIDHLPDQT